ncbi:MAG: hypothetical protein XD78_0590 [Desulfotomaculum sp. 46_296]|nr:MAG: hypothetical protein XD78_0590 [Desulfotomaculum sp. 46_296]
MKKEWSTPRLNEIEIKMTETTKGYTGNDGMGCGAGQGCDHPGWTPPAYCCCS